MEIWPAIDLLGGNCVRLRQGDYSRNTIFSQNPGQVAQEWFDAGRYTAPLCRSRWCQIR